MPLPKGYKVFPAGFDELEGHVAGLYACVVFTGKLDADDLGTAAFKKLFDEEVEKNPTVSPAVIAANILTFTERDMSIERVDFVGSPLRVTWFVLEYHAWVLICLEWRSRLGEMRAEERLAGSVHCSGDSVESCGPPLVAALTRNRAERLAWLAGRPSSYWPD